MTHGRRPRAALTLGAAVLLTAAASAQTATWQDVIRNLRHPDAKVRLEAVRQLGDAAYASAADRVAPLVGDPDDEVQSAAIDAELTFFLVEPIGARRTLGFLGPSRPRAQEAFEAGPLVRSAMPAPPELVDALIAAIRDENPRVQFDAVHALGIIAEPPLSDQQAAGLIDDLDHYDATIRAATARVIGRLRLQPAADKLIAGLSDSSPVVQRFAIEALGLIRVSRAAALIAQVLRREEKGEMASTALLALARLAQPASAELFRAHLADKDPEMRRAALEGLGRLGGPASAGTVRPFATGDPKSAVRLAACFALDRLGESQAPALVAALASRETGAQARDYLLEIGRSVLPALQAALRAPVDARHRADLLHVLGFIGSAEDAAVANDYRQDPDEDVARAAADALLRLRRAAAGRERPAVRRPRGVDFRDSR